MPNDKKDAASSIITAAVSILLVWLIHVSIVFTVGTILVTLVWLAARLSEEKS